MALLRNTLLMTLALSAAGCGNAKSADPAEVIAKLTAINERTCACKDMACMQSTEKEHAKMQEEVRAVDKNDKAVLSKLAELEVAHNTCVEQAMAAQGHK